MAVKILVSLPQELIIEIDRIVADERLSRSKFIQEALRTYLEGHHMRKPQMKKTARKNAPLDALAAELAAWELASDETIEKFEKDLQQGM